MHRYSPLSGRRLELAVVPTKRQRSAPEAASSGVASYSYCPCFLCSLEGWAAPAVYKSCIIAVETASATTRPAGVFLVDFWWVAFARIEVRRALAFAIRGANSGDNPKYEYDEEYNLHDSTSETII